MLASLPAHEPGQQSSDRIRARCHAALLAKRKPAKAMPIPVKAGSWRLVFESAAVAVACAVYLAEVFRRAMTLYGF